MTRRYNPAEIEPKWQKHWDDQQTFKTTEESGKPKAYILDMFPYPSGAGLHVGHPEGYTATDIVARKLRAQGVNVLHPMGWDAFGLPAEQYAIQTGTHPHITTKKNIETFKRQIKALGLSYDWSREIDTTDPSYVKWTQWIFLKLFKRGLAYQTEIPVNWCPALGTVLANEEVKDGVSERGGFPVERRPLRQWMLKITAYGDRLLSDLDLLDWPEGTRRMQQEWIGRSEGARVRFALDGFADHVEVYTTRPDTLFGVSYMTLAPEHPLVDKITTPAQRTAIEAYKAEVAKKSDFDRKADTKKTGVFTGAHVVHPLSGNKVPVWIGDYVLWGYGTGAVMGVPAHDQRDYDFAKTFKLPIIEVVKPPVEHDFSKAPYEEDGTAINSAAYDGLSTAAFKQKVIADLEAKNIGASEVQYKLRDWVFSRQRYWGEPFPIYFPVDTQGDPRTEDNPVIRYDQPIAVEESELPVNLPDLEDFKPSDDPLGPLARAKDWRFFQKGGKWFARETNTMPQWAGSCWYYLRFTDPNNNKEGWSKDAAQRWLPVDLYVGGAEHSVLHLLYARFWHKVLFDEGLVPSPEPFAKLVHQGLILGELEYTYRKGDQTINASEEDVEKKGGNFVLKTDPNIVVEAKAHKMSKSRGNVVNPDLIIDQYGADAMRLYEMFLGPLEATKPWNTRSIEGVRRFLDKVYGVAEKEHDPSNQHVELMRMAHQTIVKVTDDIDHLRFNTSISAMMVLTNALHTTDKPPRAAVEILAQLLAPFAPHLAEEVWQILGHASSVQHAPWPKADPALLKQDSVEVAVQVNGKVRGRITLPTDANEELALSTARADTKLATYLDPSKIKQVRWVPGKILTIVSQ